ncbi:hypothetical protein [Amycolatopsis sp. EV170708-02-1]|nr:hypothetical protein [Amycolatopsis sp. EV170708-02-1]UMP01473.1 hypothetical protein MJQ72_34330 [Amycolatopsis sp. EV170708-02-1]
MTAIIVTLALIALVTYLLERNHARQARPDAAGGDSLGRPFWRGGATV